MYLERVPSPSSTLLPPLLPLPPPFLPLLLSLFLPPSHSPPFSLSFSPTLPSLLQGMTIPINNARPNTNLCYTKKEPIGVCGLVVPWNYPLMMLAWKMAPCLAAGNTVVIKPAEVCVCVCGCGWGGVQEY